MLAEVPFVLLGRPCLVYCFSKDMSGSSSWPLTSSATCVAGFGSLSPAGAA